MTARRPVVVDLFCGTGGMSVGIKQALGRSPVAAVNHSPQAIAAHLRNHPETKHFTEDIFAVRPLVAAAGREIDLLALAPDCTHHSRAKGGKPRDNKSRSLAWVTLDWLRDVRPRIVLLENVPEFEAWGPLYPSDHPNPKLRDRPIPERRGETFREFVASIRSCGYHVDWRCLVAADFGAPTSRKRLFLVARRDGLPIVWPTPTHGPGRAQPWRTAAECIDWSVPCPSIFTRKRPLAEATQRRIAAGLVRYVLENPSPYIVCLTHGGRLERGDEPLRTVTTANGGERAVVAPVLVQTGYGERQGQAPRCLDVEAPLGTIVAGGNKHAVVAAWLAKHYSGEVGQGATRPLGTITAIDHHSLVAAHLTPFYGSATSGKPIDAPHPTVTTGGGRGGGHSALVAAFLTKYYGEGSTSQGVDEPLHTIVTKARFGLVTVQIAGEEYAVVDIGMRMLTPRELARAQGFPEDYLLTGTKAQQIAGIGNSVCPPIAEAIVRSLFRDVEMPEVQTSLWGAA